MRWWFKQQLYIQIFICILIGVGLGVLLGPQAEVIKPVGDIFIRLLKMLIVPLTLFTLVAGITKMGDLSSLRSVGGSSLLYYLVTSFFAAGAGMIVALVIQPGKEAVGLLNEGAKIVPKEFSFIDNVVGWVPTNPVDALATTNMLQIIFFSIILGVALLSLGKRVEAISNFINQGSELMIKITEMVMKVAPYGVLALTANMVGSMGSKLLVEMGRFILADTLAILLIIVLVYPMLLKLVAKKSPLKFLKNSLSAMLVAASTTSSAATLPVSMRVAKENMGVSKKIFSFTLPLGATVNMDGLAACLGIIGVFAANLYGIEITFGLMLQFVFLGLVLSIGAAGVKGSGIVMSTILLQTLNLPLTLIPILAATWPLIDIAHTTCNVTGDLTGTTLIGSKFDELDEDVFNGTKEVALETNEEPQSAGPAGVEPSPVKG